jgi:hypothetical protein
MGLIGIVLFVLGVLLFMVSLARRRGLALALVVSAVGCALSLWGGHRPNPAIFLSEYGPALGWGTKGDNVTWQIVHSFDDLIDNDVAYVDPTGLRITFTQNIGWIVFHHFPMPPWFNRYSHLEFAVRRANLSNDVLRVRLYGDDHVPYPTEMGIVVDSQYENHANTAKPNWSIVRIPLDAFAFPDKAIIGIGIGKADGTDEGSFYLDSVHLVERK